MGLVLSGVFLTNSVEKHDNIQIIKGLLLVESTIKIAGPLHHSADYYRGQGALNLRTGAGSGGLAPKASPSDWASISLWCTTKNRR